MALIFPLLHHGAGHVVGNHGGRNAVLHQLPRRQSRTLKKGTGFVGENVDFLSLFDGRANHSQRRAVSAGGERARHCSG